MRTLTLTIVVTNSSLLLLGSTAPATAAEGAPSQTQGWPHYC